MPFCFCYRSYFVGKRHRFHEILEFEFFGYLFRLSCDGPSADMLRHGLGFHGSHRLCAPFARNAFFLCQIHTTTLSRDTIILMKTLFFRLRAIFEVLFDTLLPLRERAARTKARTAEEIPLCPTVHELLKTRITTLMDYQQGAVQDLIRSLKYDGSGHAAQLAAELLADFLREEISSHRSFSQHKILIVPVPLHSSRARERGFNQIELVLKALPQEFCDGALSTLMPGALVRIRETKQQTRLPRSERLSNVAGAFSVPNPEHIQKTHVFLIDDVTTTGATLVNAATPLRRAGAEVTLLALARA